MARHKRSKINTVSIIIVALCFAVLGIVLLRNIRAASNYVSNEAETGSLAGGATEFSDTTASGGKGIKFGMPDLGPSGQPMPLGNLPGWKQIFAEDFTKNAALGSWGTDEPDTIVYTGATGTKWRTYPDGWPDTYGGKYLPGQVLSVHDGVLDFHLRDGSNGKPLGGANPSPVITGTSQYQTYGRYAARLKLDVKQAPDYYLAWLLWPEDEDKWKCAESDYPEARLDGNEVNAFHHNSPKCDNNHEQSYASEEIDWTKWHTLTQEWAPGVRRYYLDNELIHVSTANVYAGPERWQLQTETATNSESPASNNAHLLLDWVAVYSYNP